jgi:hypothetical protein
MGPLIWVWVGVVMQGSFEIESRSQTASSRDECYAIAAKEYFASYDPLKKQGRRMIWTCTSIQVWPR